VARAERRRGLGRGLLERAEDWARARGLGAVRVRSRLERADAHAFYTRLGYRETKRQVQFRKEL
jgi:GNAT superfamily N-acetyltransferase